MKNPRQPNPSRGCNERDSKYESHDKQIRKYTMKAPFFLTSAAFYKLGQLIALLIFIMLNSSAAYAKKEAPPKPIFKLVQGQGTEVCEAYLQRLNATEYLDNNPVKGRETEPLLKGFVDLKPVPLTAEEIQRIYYKTLSFERYQDQNLLEDFFKKGEESQRKRGFPVGGLSETMGIPPNTLDIINKSIVANQKTPFVRYQMQLDLDNDGIAGDVIIKNNRGVFIVDHQLQQIDENRMKRIFADQEALAWPTMVQFPTLAFPTTVFGYNNRYYFDGFFNNLNFEGPESINPLCIHYRPAPYLLGVFIHQRNQTQRICEYEWVNAFYEEWINDFEAIYWKKK